METEKVKIWLDDWREAPRGYVEVHSVNEAELMIINCENQGLPIVLIDCDYDLGMYETDGGNGLALLEWLNDRGTYYPVEIHSTHPIGSMRMENFVASFWP